MPELCILEIELEVGEGSYMFFSVRKIIDEPGIERFHIR